MPAGDCDGNGGSRSCSEQVVLEVMMQLVEELSRLLGDIDRIVHGLASASAQALRLTWRRPEETASGA